MKPTQTHVKELLQRGYRFALARSHSSHEADDLLQEAWMGLLRANGAITAGYLFSCIRSRFVDRLRRQPDAPPASLETVDEPATAESRDEDWGPPAPNGAMAAALASLRPEERAALYLSVVEGYSANAIGDLFGWPRGTVLSHMSRARAKLRQRLRPDDGKSG